MVLGVPIFKHFRVSIFLGLSLACQAKALVIMPKISSCQTIYEKERVKVQSTALPLYYKKRLVKITMYLGLDNIIKLKVRTDFDKCAILNVLNCLTKNFEP